MDNTKVSAKQRELKALKNSYESIIRNMQTISNELLDCYPYFESKEELNTLINLAQDFKNKAVVESNNILAKMLK